MEESLVQGPVQGWILRVCTWAQGRPSLLTHQRRQSKRPVASFAGSDSCRHGGGLELEEELSLEKPAPIDVYDSSALPDSSYTPLTPPLEDLGNREGNPSVVLFFFFFFFCFLGPHLWHTEVPGLGVKSELQLAGLHHSYSNARSKPHL